MDNHVDAAPPAFPLFPDFLGAPPGARASDAPRPIGRPARAHRARESAFSSGESKGGEVRGNPDYLWARRVGRARRMSIINAARRGHQRARGEWVGDCRATTLVTATTRKPIENVADGDAADAEARGLAQPSGKASKRRERIFFRVVLEMGRGAAASAHKGGRIWRACWATVRGNVKISLLL
ncbi:hypothetical protein TRAPUB_3027 [Trametes pubescens]|uniref:Uncharacterized protein n=1 Tax=Trametes pubescens TaxID=154538 RepID=A0A1M2VEQ4_TRAPU|nr:hypothetical protein TRAPUB_3027 [Trametes pubescens]